jgi:SAM-dependent methyltransferase
MNLVLTAPDFEYGSLPGEFQVVACSRCGHQFIDPLPSPADVPRLYSDAYYTVNTRSPLHFKGFVKRLKQRHEISHTARLVGSPPPRSILEVGCGNGQRLAQLKRTWTPTPRSVGVDLSVTPAVRAFAEAQGVELFEANIDQDLNALAGQSFDLILMSQLIEHLRDPIQALVRLKEVLSPHGRILIETPNRGGLDYRLFKRRFWGGYHLPRHFHLFTQDTLRTAVEAAGMHVAQAGYLASPGLWIMSLRNRLGLSSVQRSGSVFEVLNFSNVFVVGGFSALDQLCLALGRETSNQYAVATHR